MQAEHGTSYHVTFVGVTCCFPVRFSQSILPGPDLFLWPHCLHMLLAATANTWRGGGVNKGDTCRRNTCVPGPRCRSCEGCKNRASMCRPFRKCLAVMGLALSGCRIQLAKNLLGTALVAFRQVEDVHIMTGRRSAKGAAYLCTCQPCRSKSGQASAFVRYYNSKDVPALLESLSHFSYAGMILARPTMQFLQWPKGAQLQVYC